MADQGEAQLAEPPPDPLWDDWDRPPRVPDTPELHLEGFDGSLDLLLDLAERERIDLSRLSVVDMTDQFLAAMGPLRTPRAAGAAGRLARAGDAPRSAAIQAAAAEHARDGGVRRRPEAKRELSRLQNLQFVRAAAGWLEAQPQLGRDVFTAPRRERDPRVASYMRLMEACLAVMEREEERQHDAVEGVYRPVFPALFRIPDALARIRRQLPALTEPTPLTGFLPSLLEGTPDRGLVARSAVSSNVRRCSRAGPFGRIVLERGHDL